jgi:hypothetical protein
VQAIKELNAKKGLTILWVKPGAKLRKILEVADKIAMTPPRLEGGVSNLWV